MPTSIDHATPRPWRTSTSWDGRNLYLVSEQGGHVALASPYRADAFTEEEERTCIEGKERCEQARANAALIVRAVNTFDEARETLRAMLDYFAPDCGIGCQVHGPASRARAVLAKMDGEE